MIILPHSSKKKKNLLKKIEKKKMVACLLSIEKRKVSSPKMNLLILHSDQSLLHTAPFILSIIMMMIVRSSNKSPHLQFPNVQEVGFIVTKDRIISSRRNLFPQPFKMRPHLRSQFPSCLPNYGQNQRIIIGQESFSPSLRR